MISSILMPLKSININKFKDEQCVVTVYKYGNTSSASIPMVINETYENGRLKKGDMMLLDAFDSGSDFLLVSNEQAFFMFDTKSAQTQKEDNRELSGYYVLKLDEFIALAKGEKVDTKEHKLAVTL